MERRVLKSLIGGAVMIIAKRHGFVGMAIVAIAAGCSAQVDESATGSSEDALGNGTYNFGTMAAPGKCMDVAGGGSADGTNVQEWQCNGTGAQSIRVEARGGGVFRLVNTSTNKCIDVSGGSAADGANVQLWTCNGTGAQDFRIDDQGNNNVRVLQASSGKCLDVAGAGTADGTNIQLWSCNGTKAQVFHVAAIGPVSGGGGGTTPPPPPPPPPPPSGGANGSWSSVAARGDGKWVRVKNLCPFPLWIHGAGSSGTLQPDDAELAQNTERDYLAPNEWSAARVTAYVDGPRQGELEKAEMTLTGGVLNFNVTYVDWVGLPLQIVGVGGNCSAAADTTGCYATQATINNGCPEGFLKQGKKCLSARTFCLDPANQGNSYCHALDGAIASCSSCGGGTTTEAYACSGTYSQNPRMCAALNRGMVNDPDDANASLYYQHGPYNTYSKWVHSVCPNIYAFSYDDWLAQGGFRACSGDELRITFCPSG